MSAIAWLCFLVAAMPCMTAWAACCPSSPEPGNGLHDPHAAHGHLDSGAMANHAHAHEPGHNPTSTGVEPGHDCDANAGACCDEALPTLEDRSPKPLPTALEAGLVASTDSVTESDTPWRSSPEQATGPPRHLRLHPRPHLEHCRFLI